MGLPVHALMCTRLSSAVWQYVAARGRLSWFLQDAARHAQLAVATLLERVVPQDSDLYLVTCETRAATAAARFLAAPETDAQWVYAARHTAAPPLPPGHAQGWAGGIHAAAQPQPRAGRSAGPGQGWAEAAACQASAPEPSAGAFSGLPGALGGFVRTVDPAVPARRGPSGGPAPGSGGLGPGLAALAGAGSSLDSGSAASGPQGLRTARQPRRRPQSAPSSLREPASRGRRPAAAGGWRLGQPGAPAATDRADSAAAGCGPASETWCYRTSAWHCAPAASRWSSARSAQVRARERPAPTLTLALSARSARVGALASDKATCRFHTGDLTMNPHLTVRRMALARVRGEAMTEAAALPLQSEQFCS